MATRNFIAGAKIVDWGSGGGLPAIPLGILFPKIEIMAVDTVGKKTKAIGHFLDELGLENVKVWQGRAESYTKKFHYSVSRGTAPLTKLWNWHLKGRIPADPESNCWVPGLLTLKGGDLTNEIETLRVASRWVKVETISIPTIGGSPADEKYLLSVNDDKDTVVA
jgi:16S rRNA (guanine527-N7)-methyltransferase